MKLKNIFPAISKNLRWLYNDHRIFWIKVPKVTLQSAFGYLPSFLASCFCDALSNSKYYREMRMLRNSSPILNISDSLKKLWHRNFSVLLRQLAECWEFSFSHYRNPVFLVENSILIPWLCFGSLDTLTFTFLYADQALFSLPLR